MAAASPAKRAPRKKATKTVTVPAESEMSMEELDRLSAELETEDGPIGPNGEIRPIEIGKRGRPGQEMTKIFSLDGTDYFIPKNPGPAVTMKFQRNLRKMHRDSAVMDALLDMLGDRALDALAASPETTPEDVADVILVVGHVLFNSLKKIRAAADPS